MADLPFEPVDAGVASRLLSAVDPEGKILHAIQALGPVADRDVVLLGRAPARARDLAALGARLAIVADGGEEASPLAAGDPGRRVVGTAVSTGLPASSADVVLAFWSAFDAPDPVALAEADRVLRPEGRLLVVADYGRDDLDPLRASDLRTSLSAASRRDGWFLASGFRIRVIHAWWAFADLAEGAALLRDAFGADAEPVIAAMRRPRLAHKVAVYHRTRGASPAGGRRSKPAGAA